MKIISPIINKQYMLARQCKTVTGREGFEDGAGLLGSILASHPALDYADELLEVVRRLSQFALTPTDSSVDLSNDLTRLAKALIEKIKKRRKRCQFIK